MKSDLVTMTAGRDGQFWLAVRGHIADKLEERRRQLESVKSESVPIAQGWCAALRWVLALPDSIINDLTKEAAEHE